MIQIVNKRTHTSTPDDIYIGRGSIYGNPFDWRGSKLAKYQCSCREEAIFKYKEYLLDKIKSKDKGICDELNRIYKLAKNEDVNLVCYCSPFHCHGDIIKEIIEEKIEKNKGSWKKNSLVREWAKNSAREVLQSFSDKEIKLDDISIRKDEFS